jgi:hypothetical protein
MPNAVRLLAAPLLAFCIPVAAAAQEEGGPPAVDYPQLPQSAPAARGFVPAGWRLEATASGDLDRDGRSDLAMVLRMNDAANVLRNDGLCGETLDTNPRILAVALAQAGGGYRLGVQDQELIPRRDNPCASDWFAPEHLSIERGTVSVSLERFMSAGGWDMGTTSFTFRWEDDNLRLIGYDFSNMKRNTGDFSGVSINYLTGRAKLTRGRMDSDRETVRWVTLHSRRPLTIWSVGDGLAFDPENLISSLP